MRQHRRGNDRVDDDRRRWIGIVRQQIVAKQHAYLVAAQWTPPIFARYHHGQSIAVRVVCEHEISRFPCSHGEGEIESSWLLRIGEVDGRESPVGLGLLGDGFHL